MFESLTCKTGLHEFTLCGQEVEWVADSAPDSFNFAYLFEQNPASISENERKGTVKKHMEYCDGLDDPERRICQTSLI